MCTIERGIGIGKLIRTPLINIKINEKGLDNWKFQNYWSKINFLLSIEVYNEN